MNSNLKLIDLFSGVGGLTLGALRAGFAVSLAVDNDEQAMAAHRRNFPKINHLESDLNLINGKTLLETGGLQSTELAGIIGGPPCQGFSQMGKRQRDDPRNELFVKFFDLIRECQPRFFLAENVPGILSKKYDPIRKKAFDKVIDGYSFLDPILLKASDFGAPTSRERVFYFGYKKEYFEEIAVEDFAPDQASSQITVAIALQGLPRIRSNWQTEQQSWRKITPAKDSEYWNITSNHIPDGVGDEEAIRLLEEEKLVSGNFGTRHTNEVKARFSEVRPGERDSVSRASRLKSNGLCPTLRAGTDSDHGSYQAVRPIHPTSPRVITPREAARLQGFPDWFQFDPTKWHSFRQIGNSVSPILAEQLFDVIFSKLKSTRQN